MPEKKGWISLHRKICDNWLWESDKPFDKRSAWIDILLMVNHKENKILMDNKLIKVEKGERITSERKLAERWGWSRTKVRNFLKLLENDNMLEVEKTTKKTTLKVVNYGKYQGKKTSGSTSEKPGEYHPSTRRVPPEDTNNNDNNENNENNEKELDEDNGLKNSKIPDAFRSAFNKNITPFQMQKLLTYLEDGLSEKMIIYSLRLAAENNADSLNYATAILDNWLKNDIKTKKQAENQNLNYQGKGGKNDRLSKEDSRKEEGNESEGIFKRG